MRVVVKIICYIFVTSQNNIGKSTMVTPLPADAKILFV